MWLFFPILWICSFCKLPSSNPLPLFFCEQDTTRARGSAQCARASAITQANMMSITFLVVLLAPKRKSKRSVEQLMQRMMQTTRLL